RRLVLLEHFAPERLPVLHVDELGDRRGEVALAYELALDVEERRLRVVDQDEARRPHTRDLAAELSADRAAGARDKDRVALEIGADLAHVDLDLLAAEHVLDLHRANLRDRDVGGDELVEPR